MEGGGRGGEKGFVRGGGLAGRGGGLFCIDFMNRERLMRNYRENVWERLHNGTLILQERSFNMLSGVNTETRTWISPEGETKTIDLLLRLYTAKELREKCEAAGLRVVKSFGDYDASPLTIDSRRVILVTQK